MTPKEKAFHLYYKYIREIIADNEKAKKCALIAVDEILNSGLFMFCEDELYWQEVKHEIEKI